MSLSRVLVPFVTAMAGGLVGWRLDRPLAHETAAPAVLESRSPATASATATDRGTLATMLRTIIREEVALALRSKPEGSPSTSPTATAALSPPSESEAVTPTPEQTDAVGRAQRVLEGARRTGQWAEDDREAFRTALMEADEGGRRSMHKALILAVNQQELKLDAPPF